MASAIAMARLRKHRVEVVDERTAQSTTWANPNGTLTTKSYAAPIRFKRGGAWVDVDTTLHATSGGVAPEAQPQGLTLARGGENSTLAAVGTGARRVAVGWRAHCPSPG
ncbi:hypothetical protein [Streptomyces sp. SA15]|uniref:hypothetical protein n=1 Tax=Streptomyces sp. SA15 TaxID=934019 RepID=UPI00117FA847|nr:hypothetical protein [Streptomyces sp. SA15]